jgi:hypothetical protein
MPGGNDWRKRRGKIRLFDQTQNGGTLFLKNNSGHRPRSLPFCHLNGRKLRDGLLF